MRKAVPRLFDVGFCIAIVSCVALYWFRDACHEQERFHLLGRTIILHEDQSVVVRNGFDPLMIYNSGLNIDIGGFQFLCSAYIAAWTSWRVRPLVRRPM